MCRLSAFFGAPICAADLVTRPCRSIITQSFDARERMTGDASTPGYLNGDGFGLGWYSSNRQDVVPCIYRQARPAWNDPNLGSIAEKVYTPVLFAHVRAASPGLDVSETTCHPFRYGRYLWMHNGCLGNFASVRRKLLPTLSEHAFDFAVSHGSSDTALCFAVFLNLIEDKMVQGSPQKLRACLEQTINILVNTLKQVQATETSLFNFVVSDGESIAASRYVFNMHDDHAKAASLYYAAGNGYQSDGSAPGNYVMTHTDRRPSLAIISSEPLTERRADWVSVPHNSTIVITKNMHILLTPICTTPDTSISRVFVNLSESKTSDRRATAKLTLPVKSPKPFTENRLSGSTIRSTITIPGRTVLCCVVMDNLVCSGTDNGTIHVWDMEDNMLCQKLQTGRRPVLAMLADSHAGVLISATSASSVTVYHLTAAKHFEASYAISCEGKGDVLSLTRVGPSVYAGFSDTRVRCVIEDIYRPQEQPVSGKVSGDDVASEGSSLCDLSVIYPAHEFPKASVSISHYGYVFAITSCLQGRFLCTGCGDGLLRIWDVSSEECFQKRDDHSGAILALVAYEVEYGTMLFSGSRDCSVKVWVWDGDSGFICKRTLRKHKDEVVFLTIFEDKLVSGSADGVVCVWCAETLALLCQYRDTGLRAGAVSVRFNALFTASDEGAIRVRDMLSTEKEIGTRKLSTGISEDRGDPGKAQSKNAVQYNNQNGSKKTETVPHIAINKQDNVNNFGDLFVSEVHEDTDEVETLLPGVTNEMILPPPMSPLFNRDKNQSTKVSGLITEKSNEFFDSLQVGLATKPPKMSKRKECSGFNQASGQALERRLMQDLLGRFVSFRTVSGSDEYREDCWQGARYIGMLLEGLGASVKYISTGSDLKSNGGLPDNKAIDDGDSPKVSSSSNPIVLARFSSANPEAKTAAFYGHYDVIPVESQQWATDPWTLTSRDGYFYGRGATDNKGPIVAMVFAVKRLLEQNRDGLGCNLILILQGEGEQSNAGFKACIDAHRHWFENTSLILTSNSYWLGEKKPCITYGFRGKIELQVSVTGGKRNLHSGVDGGAVYEPMNDLITVLGTMVDSGGEVCIPGFYDDVRPLTAADKKLLNDVEFDLDEYKNGTGVERFTCNNARELLVSRWRKPSISITSVQTSNPSGFFSVLPRQACAKISIRFVPDQNPTKIEEAVTAHLGFEMRKRRSPNILRVQCVNKGDWWLGDPNRNEFQIAERAITSVWGVKPEYVCEGGSMPLFSYLVKTLDAPLVQVPLGQSSDGAHLPNERIRAINLFRGKEVLQKIIEDFTKKSK